MSTTSIVTLVASAFTTTSNGPVADFTGNAIMTDSCTSPYIASFAMPSGGPLEYPWVGCSDQSPDCCPFDLGAEGPLTVCPHDYVTISGACCPNGWGVYTRSIAGQLPCFTTPAIPLAPPGTSGSGPAPTVISSQLFTLRYTLEPTQSTLSPGAQAGIGVGAAAGALSIASVALLMIRRRRQAYARRAATIPRSPYEAPQDFSPKTPASGTTFGHPFAPATPQTPIRSELPSPPPQHSPSRSVFRPAPISASVTELPGSTFLHEHHPVYTRPATPTAGAGETSQGRDAGVGVAVTSTDETYRPPFASVEENSELARAILQLRH
ncbi:MAG: hypothetical protein LQ340_005631 [Diploschistes diacapsis]|nr:MAG: hypothetical protein LQ340_005631 [Diploschistes diacapsis]